MPSLLATPVQRADSGEPPTRRRADPRPALFVVAAWTAFGVLQAYLWVTLTGRAGDYFPRMLGVTLTTAWTWALLTPLIARLARRYSWESARFRALGIHFVAALLLGALDTALRRWAIGVFLDGTPGVFLETFFFRLDINLIAYFTVATVASALEFHRRYRERKLRAVQLQTQLSTAQLQVLTMQLQPHFLFNTLHAISELMHDDPAEAERMSRHLSDLLRLSIEHATEQEVPLRDELAFLDAYLEIECTRFGDRLQVRRDIEPALLDAEIPHLLLQPLVENAIRHGIAPRAAPGTIEIGARQVGDELVLSIRDDGVGLHAKRSAGRSGGLGLRNTRARLAQLYNDGQRLDLQEAPNGGTIATIRLPLRYAAPEIVQGTGEYEAAYMVPTPAGIAAASRESALAAAAARARAAEAPPAEPAIVVAPAPTGEVPAAAPPPEPRAGRRRVRRILGLFGVIVAGWTMIGLFWTNQLYLWLLAGRRGLSEWRELLVLNMTGAWVWALITPAVLWMAGALRITRHNWWWRAPLHATLGFVIGWGQLGLLALLSFSPVDPDFFNVNNLGQFYFNLCAYYVLVAVQHRRDFYRWYQARELEAARLESDLAHTRLEMLKMELQPHFVLRTLRAVCTLVHTDVPRADRLISRLGDLLRLTLDNIGRDVVPLKQELEFLGAFLEVERTRVGDLLQVRMGIDPDALDANVPHLILQPLIERAIGDEALDAGVASRIDIGAHRHNGTLSLEVRSAGERPSTESAVTRLETRFRSTRARLEQVYGPLHRVDVVDRGAEGLVLRVELPFRSSGTRASVTREPPLVALAAS